MASTDMHIPTRRFYPAYSNDSFQSYARGPDEIDNKTSEIDNAPNYMKNIYNSMNTNAFYSEEERLKTFNNWPLDWLDRCQLAQTGMFYTGDADKVKCYFCEVEIGRWEREDEPVSEHLRWSPNCPLLRRRTTNNMPLSAELLDRILPPISYDICGANDSTIDVHPNAYAEGTIPASRFQMLRANEDSTSYYPEYPEYSIEAARERSFIEWPRHMKQRPSQLASAGFFYTGVGDRVKCFSCGGGLKDWDDNDDPWEQHALWMNKCWYVKLIKGQSYIDAIKAKFQPQPQSTSTTDQQQQQPMVESTNTTTASSSPSDVKVGQVLGGGDCCPARRPACLVNTSTNTTPNGDVLPPNLSAVANVKPLSLFTDCIANNKTTTTTATEAANDVETQAAANKKKSNSTNIPEEKLCKICYNEEYNTAFLPCGHVVACAKCAASVTKCPLCRKPFTDVMRVYFS